MFELNTAFLYFGALLLALGVGFYLAVRAVNKMELEANAKETDDDPSSVTPLDGVLLSIELPKENEKTPLAAEQMYASLHGLLRFTQDTRDHVSLEMVSTHAGIRFYVFTPINYRNFVEGQIYAQYPDAEIKEVPDYTNHIQPGSHVAATDLVLTKDQIFPIKSFRDFEEVDPLASITSALGKIADNEQVWVQILIHPREDDWQEHGNDYVKKVREGIKPSTLDPAAIMGDVTQAVFEHVPYAFDMFFNGPKVPEAPRLSSPQTIRLSAGQELELKAIENKLSKMGFDTKIRILANAKTAAVARERVESVAASFKQFSTANLNSFATAGIEINPEKWIPIFRKRDFSAGESFVMAIDELASIYHMPNISVETPHIAWTRATKGEPPLNLPVEGTPEATMFAETVFRDTHKKFGIKRADRRKHQYLIGKTGSGKSTLIKNMIIQDIQNGEGVAVLDPHGDLIHEILNFIPEHRLQDVVIFDPADAEYPVALNMLEVVDPRQRNLIASGLLDVFKKYFGQVSWGPRLEYLLMNSILTLLEVPNTSMLGIVRLLTDSDYNKYIVSMINDPVMKDFWNKEFMQMKGNQKLVTEAVSPIQNKVGQFLNASTIRNIVGQSKSTIRIDEIINQGKIFLVNLSTGRIGESNSALLGAMIISQIQFAAMRRVDIPETQRRDFYVYADEFQKFATDSFATILSEARKYRLNLILTHQYIEQMPESVKEAVFGNVGTLMTYAIGPTDAAFLEKEFEPTFLAQDIINLGQFEMYLKLQIDDVSSHPFSAKGLAPSATQTGNAEEAINLSRSQYSRRVEIVEDRIRRWTETRFQPGMGVAAQTSAPSVEPALPQVVALEPVYEEPKLLAPEVIPTHHPMTHHPHYPAPHDQSVSGEITFPQTYPKEEPNVPR